MYKENHNFRDDPPPPFDTYVKGDYILCNSNLLSPSCFFGVSIFKHQKEKEGEKSKETTPKSEILLNLKQNQTHRGLTE